MSRITAADLARTLASDPYDTDLHVIPEGEKVGPLFTATPREWDHRNDTAAVWDVRDDQGTPRFEVVLTVTEVKS